MTALAILFVASIWADAENALAGGGSFITLPSLMLTGMDARAANITSTVALFPAQLVTGFTGRSDAMSPLGLPMRTLIIISLIGGALGALILLWTPPTVFARLVPWLVLFATALFAWGSFFRGLPQPGEAHLPPWGAGHRAILHRHLRRLFRRRHRPPDDGVAGDGGTRRAQRRGEQDILAGGMNASAVAIFALSSDVHWIQAAVTAVGASIGGWAGAMMLKTVNEKFLNLGVIAIGVLLTIGLFWNAR